MKQKALFILKHFLPRTKNKFFKLEDNFYWGS